jgi:HSP20 family molecular chaperone IbpA
MRRCNYCKKKMKDNWNYCPKCGSKVNKPITMTTILRKQMDILKNLMRGIDEDYEERHPRNAITIRIDSRGLSQPRIQVSSTSKKSRNPQNYKIKNPPSRKLPSNIIEPQAEIKRLAKEIVITIPLPGVKSEKDIELSRFSDSMELRAFAKKKGYFKILNIPSQHKLLQKDLTDGKLSLKFAV